MYSQEVGLELKVIIKEDKLKKWSYRNGFYYIIFLSQRSALYASEEVFYLCIYLMNSDFAQLDTDGNLTAASQ